MRPSLILIIVLTCAAFAAPAQVIQEFKTTSTSVIGYIEYIPKDYVNNSYNYPVVIFLHGLAERGPNSTDPAVLRPASEHLDNYGPPFHVRNGTQFPFILISPQLKNNHGDWPGWYVMEVIEHVKTYLRVDPKRIYLTGSSLGGGGTWTAAQDYPDYFAAVAPVMGSWNTPSKACLLAASNLPVWAFHSDDDNVVPYIRSVNMVNAINACNPTIPAQLKTYHGYYHNAFVQAYDLGTAYQSPNIYEWMLQWVNDHTNKVPKANAGSDQSVVLPASSVTITGAGTDTDGTINSYSWSQISGANLSLSNATTNKLTVSSLTAGIYTFRLVVRDDKGSVSSDDVNLYVKTSVNAVPVSKAGSDKTVTLPSNSITVTGSGTDTDGYIVSHSWSKISGGAATLSGMTTPTFTASGMSAGTYTFRLTVTDDNGATKTDDMNVYVNNAPSANAGADKTITLPTSMVTFMGSGSDSDGTISSYAWSKVSGGSATLSNATTASLTASNLTAGTYVFRLEVKDNRGATKTDDVQVIVNPASGSNVAPTVSTGSDKLISLPTSSISIAGTATDSDGTIATFSWLKLSGGSATLSGANTATLTASGLAAGVYVFQLTVTDDDGASTSDDVKITVNAAPVVNAGTDRLITLPTNSVTITGSATDADGTIATWTWTKISGGAATLAGATTKTMTASALAAGSYTFRLTVKDDRGGTQSDDIVVIVNIPPVSNAGSNQTITLPVNSTTLPGGGTDADGTITVYAWTKISGGAATLSGTSGTTLGVQGMVAGTYIFRLTVTDNRGSYRYDDVTVLVNIPPVPNAGADKNLVLPSNAVSLVGSGTDPDGTVSSYSWTKVSGGTAYMSGNSTTTLSLTGLVAGSYVFRLTVRDNKGAAKSDDVVVTVSSSTSGSSLAEAEVLSESEISQEAGEGDVLNEGCGSCRMVVFNESLERVYDGHWKNDSDAEAFPGRGLFYYKIIRAGEVVRRGKIFRE